MTSAAGQNEIGRQRHIFCMATSYLISRVLERLNGSSFIQTRVPLPRGERVTIQKSCAYAVDWLWLMFTKLGHAHLLSLGADLSH